MNDFYKDEIKLNWIGFSKNIQFIYYNLTLFDLIIFNLVNLNLIMNINVIMLKFIQLNWIK